MAWRLTPERERGVASADGDTAEDAGGVAMDMRGRCGEEDAGDEDSGGSVAIARLVSSSSLMGRLARVRIRANCCLIFKKPREMALSSLVLRATARAAGRRANKPLARALSTHVSVIGLHWKTDEIRLRQAFEQYGTLEKAQVLTPEHSSTHLWASLVYSTFDEALEAASEMNGQELDGRLLRVSIVDPPAEDDAAGSSSTELNTQS